MRRDNVVFALGIACGVVIAAGVFIGLANRILERNATTTSASVTASSATPSASTTSSPAPSSAPQSPGAPSAATTATSSPQSTSTQSVTEAPPTLASSSAPSPSVSSASIPDHATPAPARPSTGASPIPAPDIPPSPVNPVVPEKRASETLASAAPSTAGSPTAALPPGTRQLIIPVEGVRPDQITDTFNDRRGGTRAHEALDIMAPRGTPVRAVADGRIVKLFDSKPGGLTIYQFDPAETVAYYYAHLDRYAAGLKEGQNVRQGDVIGYVGSTGNADPNAPHLHFAMFRLGPEKHWWQGTAINPFPLIVTH